MAKKKTAALPTTMAEAAASGEIKTDTPAKGPQTPCLSGCGAMIHPRAKTCPQCGATQNRGSGNTARPNKASKAKGGKPEAAIGEYQTSLFALRAGGVEEAKAALEALADDPAMAFAIRAGGIAEALRKVEELGNAVDGNPIFGTK